MSTEPTRKRNEELQAMETPGGGGRGEGAVGNSTRDEEIRLAHTKSISNTANNQALSWRIGSKLSVNSKMA
jgi:hypothetical protein